ncbi:hypothetical protein EZ216_03895 [Ramlibacter humi]|uniref:Uncharacterized protein n=2 Tax=Ramlibacter humi TaxID=2530451 RepID=A0A4Z0CAE9_9BURK|nr:hypothetical protein EZ216_03895 [Ramlibacter humi]
MDRIEATGMKDEQLRVLARIAALERLRDQAVAGDRPAMLHSVEHLLKGERQLLRSIGAASAAQAA